MFNCNIINLTFKYLSVPIRGNHNRIVFWNGLLDKIRKKLSKWKGELISMAGRAILIRFVISTKPLYLLSLFKVPKIVCSELITIQRQFLRGWGCDKKKLARIKWRTVCNTRECGGLSIKDIEKFNKALLGK